MTLFTAGVLERSVSRLWDRDKTKGVSALTVRGIHSMDTLCHCLGDFVEVSAKVATQVKQWKVTETGATVDVDAADNVLVNGVLKGGALASVHVATLPYHTTGWRMEIYGRGGTLRVSTRGRSTRREQPAGVSGSRADGCAGCPGSIHRGAAGNAGGPAEQCRASLPAHGQGHS
jgi:predicted dehydrogenase